MISRSKVGSLRSWLGRCPEKQSTRESERLMDAVGRKGSCVFLNLFCCRLYSVGCKLMVARMCMHSPPHLGKSPNHKLVESGEASLHAYFLVVLFSGWPHVVPHRRVCWTFAVRWHGSFQALLSSKLAGYGTAIQVDSKNAEKIGSLADWDICGITFALLADVAFTFC